MEDIHICEYGCGKVATYQFKNGKWCCSKNTNNCPCVQEKMRFGQSKAEWNYFGKEIKTEEICSFGCGQKANFIYKNGSFCCVNDWHRCPGKLESITQRNKLIWSDLDRRKRLSETQHKDLFAVAIPVMEDDKKCFYCGKKANFWFKTNNKFCCCDRIERCPVVSKQISNRMIEKWKDEEFREHHLEIQKLFMTDEWREKISSSNKQFLINHPEELERRIRLLKLLAQERIGKTFEELYGNEKAAELKRIKSEERLGKTDVELYGIEKAKQMAKSRSLKMTGRIETRSEVLLDMGIKKRLQWEDLNSSYNSEEFRKKKSEDSKRNWKNPEYIKKMQKGLHNSPNGPERKLIEVFNQLNLNYEFVGDWSISIDGRNPDFINRKTNKLIEHFGLYYHDTIVNLSREEHEQERINHFEKNGYKTLIIWEDELKDMPNLIEKILKFDQQTN